MFIVEGIMKCYSINERQTILKLQAGDFFGEKALLGVTKRIYPIVAETFCSVFSLSKANFDAILDKFPQIAVVVKDMRKLFQDIINII
jgi:cAMP-binding proteins - catabolite gene activator and regulatory subunit of cAMP-dependent protein kinases